MIRLWSIKNLYLKEKPWKHRCWKGYWSKVESRATLVGRKAVGSFFSCRWPAHSAVIHCHFTSFSGESWHCRDSHPPYSPDLVPADFSWFSWVETSIKGRRFKDIEGIKKNVTAKLNVVLWVTVLCNFQKEVPYILEYNAHPFYSFRGPKSWMHIRFAVESWIF
jgi:hypothetical protein